MQLANVEAKYDDNKQLNYGKRFAFDTRTQKGK